MARVGHGARRRDRISIAIGVVALVVALAAIIWVSYHLLTRKPGLNPTTLCPADGPKGHYVLLVDKTDPLNFVQKEAFKVTLRELIERKTPEGYLLSVFVLGEDFQENAKPIVELCNPGTGSDKSPLTENLARLKRQYNERFLEPLLKMSDALWSLSSANASPIFEMLQLVSINAFRKNDVKGERRLIMMSDMLQNTPQLSMYKGSADFAAAFLASDYGKMQLELRDVDVELHYLMNSPKLQTRRHIQFWEDFFRKAGARIVAVRPMEG